MTPASCKAKGRKLQQHFRDLLYMHFPSLQPGDIESTSMGASGVDLKLSPAARAVFPFSVEAKSQEALNIWAALKQAEANAPTLPPLLVFSRNRSPVYVALRAHDFLNLFPRT